MFCRHLCRYKVVHLVKLKDDLPRCPKSILIFPLYNDHQLKFLEEFYMTTFEVLEIKPMFKCPGCFELVERAVF